MFLTCKRDEKSQLRGHRDLSDSYAKQAIPDNFYPVVIASYYPPSVCDWSENVPGIRPARTGNCRHKLDLWLPDVQQRFAGYLAPSEEAESFHF